MMNFRTVFGVVVALLLSGCNAARFSAKEKVLMSKSVFGEDSASGSIQQPGSGDPASGSLNQGGGGGSSSGSLNQGGGSGSASGGLNQGGSSGVGYPLQQPSNGSVPIILVCSDYASTYHTSFKHALKSDGEWAIDIGNARCTNDKDEVSQIILNKVFTAEDQKRLCPGLEFNLQIPIVFSFGNEKSFTMPTANGQIIQVYYANNKLKEPADEAADEKCDQKSSPLVVHLKSDVEQPEPIRLTSIEDGIWFDLLGSQLNYEKVRIGWFTDYDYALLALPDTSGEVHSIDQLFGNATFGPDHNFAANGYEALAKYDHNGDFIIDQNDAVFSKLKLWVDENFDGIGQAYEMRSLDEASLSFIDLKFSDAYQETDRHGNTTMMKSVVGYSDGTLDLIFDLWFAYQVRGF